MAKPQERTYGIGTTLMWASLGAVGAGLLTYALFVPWYAIGFTYSLARREHAILFGVLDAVTYMIVPAGCGIASGVLSWGLWKRGEPRTKAWDCSSLLSATC